MLNFREFYFREQNTVGTHNDYAGGAYLSSDQTGSEASPTMGMLGHPLHLPSLDIALQGQLPTVTKRGRITFIELRKNPIRVVLSDGTQLFLSYDQYNKFPNKPEVGRNMEVVFQRHPKDSGDTPSKIERVQIY